MNTTDKTFDSEAEKETATHVSAGFGIVAIYVATPIAIWAFAGFEWSAAYMATICLVVYIRSKRLLKKYTVK